MEKERGNIEEEEVIELHGVRVNNLKNISLTIPRDQLVVISGLSGSGKSSLAFDTLYAEGQRRYVESLSVYARQFVSRMAKPEADYIIGIPPAIAIEQRKFSKSQRSTVGTTTEVYDYLRMLFARIGRTISPISGTEVKRHTVADVVDFVHTLPAGSKYLVCTPMTVPRGRPLADHLQLQLANGYSRLRLNNEVVRIQELLERKGINRMKKSGMDLVIDRLTVVPNDDITLSRLGDSLETAFFEGRGVACIVHDGGVETFSDQLEADGITFEEPSDNLFSFNSSVGACPTCEGYGQVLGIDENLVIPNKRLSLYDGCVACWRGPKMSVWQHYFIENSSTADFPIHRPYYQLTKEEHDLLWDGDKSQEIYGINDFFDYISKRQYKMHYRIMLARYRGRATCPTCKGKRLKPEALYVQVGGKNISDLVHLPISELHKWLQELELDTQDAFVAKRLMEELRQRVGFLNEIGLGYLTLDRMAGTLSGGESQRITIATTLGGGLVGALYILDEPSIGLHPRDTHLLLNIMRELTDSGNTVVVVEHDEDVIRAADLLIDMGPDAGTFGGEVVFIGSPNALPQDSKIRSYTLDYLQGKRLIKWPEYRRQWKQSVQIKGAYRHNLKDIQVEIPLHAMTVVTGVSGSGKSSLVRDIIYEGLKLKVQRMPIDGIECQDITGSLINIKQVVYVDQESLSTSSRSNPITYIGTYDWIRKLMAEQPLAKQLGYTQQHFSFNKEGGRCEYCKGDGVITIEMQFMADMEIECEECHGKRFNEDTLEIRFEGKNIADILALTVDEALTFFSEHEAASTAIPFIIDDLKLLQSVGLGYVRLGQSSSTLSGGENQRVKLASYLTQRSDRDPTLFIFDEPTTGLHIHDIHVLMSAFNALIDRGHTLLIVEHNLDVIKLADHVIDLGPDGGEGGGYLLYQGTPEGLMELKNSYTGHFLKEKWLAENKA